jgi:hypothetical protein
MQPATRVRRDAWVGTWRIGPASPLVIASSWRGSGSLRSPGAGDLASTARAGGERREAPRHFIQFG